MPEDFENAHAPNIEETLPVVVINKYGRIMINKRWDTGSGWAWIDLDYPLDFFSPVAWMLPEPYKE